MLARALGEAGDGNHLQVIVETIEPEQYENIANVSVRHMNRLHRKTRQRCRSLGQIAIAGMARYLEPDDIHRIVDETLPSSGNTGSLNRERERFVGLIGGLLSTQPDYYRQDSGTVRSLVRTEVECWCSDAWPSIDFRDEYVSLISDVQGMIELPDPPPNDGVHVLTAASSTEPRFPPPPWVPAFAGTTEGCTGSRQIELGGESGELSKGAIDGETASALARSVETVLSNGFGDPDLGALAYMNHMLNGTVGRRYRHIVVDEV